MIETVPRPLAISPGDPAGVGPLVTLSAAAKGREPVAVFGDAGLLRQLARAVGIPEQRLVVVQDVGRMPTALGTIALVDVVEWDQAAIRAHEPDQALGDAQLIALESAARFAASGRARALVTGPISKTAVALGGRDFSGHTEHLARMAGMAPDGVTMMFLGPNLAVALVTTHLSIRGVPAAITPARVARTCRHLALALTAMLGHPPRIAVAALNPHAGEGGLFGDEEGRVLVPTVTALREEPPFSDGGAELTGVLGAETAMRAAQEGQVDGVVAMMHDQATIASKLLDWGRAANVTWGLPYVRTSVDHGVAYEAARGGSISDQGMCAALGYAVRLSAER